MTRVEQDAAIVVALARGLGLSADTPILLRTGHRSSFHLSDAGLVAKVHPDEPDAERRARRELAVARGLHERRAPVPPVCEGRIAGPHRAEGRVVTLWLYHRHTRSGDDGDATIAAETLAAAHRALRTAACPLPPFTDMLDRCWRVLATGTALPEADRELLHRQGGRLRAVVEGARSPIVALHGDAHTGNLLLGGDGPAWIDWEEACTGPVEWDLGTLPPAAWPRFPDADPALAASCSLLRSVTIAIWCGAGSARSETAREAAAFHLGRVRATAE